MIASMIFFPTREYVADPKTSGLPYEEVICVTQDKVKLKGWFFPAPNAKSCLLFFHGNADNIGSRIPKAKEWVKRGVSVLLVDYRGYGKSEGEIKAACDLTLDAEAALAWLAKEKGIAPENIILYGESIGSVPSIELANKAKFKAVILEAPFTSVKDMAKLIYGMAPDFMLKDFEMNNEERIRGIKSPVFIMQGSEDDVVPFSMGQKVFKNAPQPKEFFEIKGAQHNNISEVAGDEFFEKPFQFVAKS